ncbi:MAG: hypothetical protein U0354_18985 [Candidatus Sericytochromatia bacterium]
MNNITVNDWEEFEYVVCELENEIEEPCELEIYLRSMYKLIDKYKLEKPSLNLFYSLIKDSFFEKPIEFNDKWLKIIEPPDEDIINDDLEFFKQVLLFQIAELRKMRDKELKDELKYFGIKSETGNYWYNFSPFMNLECGLRGFIGNKNIPSIYSENINWKTLGIILEVGRIYE